MSALSAAASDEDGDIIKTLQARVDDLEAQLYAVGAGGVGSPVARQDHHKQHLDMVPAGWKLVPVEPTEEMLRSSCGCESPAMFRESLRRETDGRLTAEMVEKIIRRHLASYRAMLAAAPHPPVVEQPQSVTDCHQSQPQGEQEPVTAQHRFRNPQRGTPDWSVWQPCKVEKKRPVWEIDSQGFEVEYQALYTHQQPKREPLTVGQINRLIADGKLPLSGNPYEVARAIERAHGIGGDK